MLKLFKSAGNRGQGTGDIFIIIINLYLQIAVCLKINMFSDRF